MNPGHLVGALSECGAREAEGSKGKYDLRSSREETGVYRETAVSYVLPETGTRSLAPRYGLASPGPYLEHLCCAHCVLTMVPSVRATVGLQVPGLTQQC